MDKKSIRVSDPSQKWKILLGVVVVFLLIVVIADTKELRLGEIDLYVVDSPADTAVATSTYVLVTSTVRLVLDTQSAAQFRCFGNASGTTPIYLGFGTSTGLTVGEGFPLQPSSTVWFSNQNGDLWKGPVYGITDVAAGVGLSVCQL